MAKEDDSLDALWNFGDPAESEARFRERLQATSAESDPDTHAEILTQIARAQGLQRNFAGAGATLDQARQTLSDDTPRANVRYLLERGRLLNSSGKPEESRALFIEALAKADDTGLEALAVDAAHMMGIVAEPGEQLDWNLRALERAESSQNPKARAWLGSLYNNIGWTLHDSNKFGQALELFEKALAWFANEKKEPQTRIAKWTVARCLRSLGRIGEAFESQQAVLREWEDAGQQDGYVHEELAECALLMGNADVAAQHFAQAHALLSKDAWLVENEATRLQRLKELSGGQTTSAESTEPEDS